MAEPKGLGSKILGAFFTTDEEAGGKPEVPGEKTAAEMVAELAQGVGAGPKPGAAAVERSALASAPLAASGGADVDFDAVFRDAGLDASELDRVRKAEELLKGLPAGIGKDVQRQIVETSLKAFGFEVGKIVAAAQMQLKALDTYVKVHEGATQKAVADAEAQVAALQEKIAAARKDIEKRRDNLHLTTQAAQARKGQVSLVLDFFAVPSSPKPGAV